MKGHVYVLRDAEGTPLYVGSTQHVADRMDHHRYKQRWWGAVAVVEVAEWPTVSGANWGEWRLIGALNPIHNKYGKPFSTWGLNDGHPSIGDLSPSHRPPIVSVPQHPESLPPRTPRVVPRPRRRPMAVAP